MPISPLTISDLQKTTAHFDFLLTAPYVNIETIPSDARFCAICKERFDNSLWQLGTTVNRPVKMECGHKFGIRCLAHLVFAYNFSNRCPVCRAQIIPDSFEENPSERSWKMMVPLLRTLTMFGGDDNMAFNKEMALHVLQTELNKRGLMRQVPGKHIHRTMVLYVEFMGRFCGGFQPMGNADRVRVAERREQRLEKLLDMSREVRRTENELRELRAKEEKRVRDERGRQLRRLQRELEATREALKNGAGGLPDGHIGSALMILGAMIYALIGTLPSERVRALVGSVIICMALGGLLYRKIR